MLRFAAALAVLLLAACDEDRHAPGTLEITIVAPGISDGISSTGGQPWAVHFDLFTVRIGGITAQPGHEAEEIEYADFLNVDLAITAQEPVLVHTFEDAPGGVYDHVGFLVDGVELGGGGDDGFNTIGFYLDLDLMVVHSHCNPGVTLDGDAQAIEISMRFDTLFRDDTGAVDFERFAIADNAPGDGQLARDELEAAGLLEILTERVAAMGRVNGDQECGEVSVLD